MSDEVKRIELLDKGWLELQDVMGGDLAIVNAARVSFLGESKGENKDKKLLFYLLSSCHSPFIFRPWRPLRIISIPTI